MHVQCLAGKKYLALAISEAFAGSDVGGLQTTAVRDGDYWIVTGTKKCFYFAILGRILKKFPNKVDHEWNIC